MAITARDVHGTYSKARKAYGPKLDRHSTRYFAIVGNQWSRGCSSRAEARREEARLRLEQERVNPKVSALTVAEFGNTVWLPVKRARLKPSSFAEVEFAWTKVEAELGSIRLRDLRPAHLRAFYEKLGQRGVTVAEKAHKALVNLLGLAVDDGYVATNVARGRDVAPRKVRREMACWDTTQLRTFLDAVADDRLFALWRLAAMTGLRRAELLGLRWSDLDLDALTLRVERGLVLTPTGDVVWSTPKTDRSRRTVGLDPATVAALKAHRKRQTADQLASLGAWPEESDEVGLVFKDAAGRALRPAGVSRKFGALVRKVAVPGIRLHDLRHGHATVLLREGVPVHVVAQRLGHASPSVTLDTYAHVLTDQRSDAAMRFAAAIDH